MDNDELGTLSKQFLPDFDSSSEWGSTFGRNPFALLLDEVAGNDGLEVPDQPVWIRSRPPAKLKYVTKAPGRNQSALGSLRSSTALVVAVVPWMKRSTPCAFFPVFSSAAITP